MSTELKNESKQYSVTNTAFLKVVPISP